MDTSRLCPTCRGTGVIAVSHCVDCGRALPRWALRCAVCGMMQQYPPNHPVRQTIARAGVPFADCLTAVRRDGGRVVFEYDS